jgi:hypothetical protein
LSGPFRLIPTWFEPASVLSAYNYIEHTQNEWGDDIIIHTGLRAVDISQLKDEPGEASEDEDPFKDLEIEPPTVRKHKGRQGKRRKAGDGKGPLNKGQQAQVCGVCGEQGHNRKTCSRLTILEGTSQGIGIE